MICPGVRLWHLIEGGKSRCSHLLCNIIIVVEHVGVVIVVVDPQIITSTPHHPQSVNEALFYLKVDLFQAKFKLW